jgi:SAM-dependent methyltransferase
VCGTTDWQTAYEGPIRAGTFGQECPGLIARCGRCGVHMLASPRDLDETYYASGQYRADVGEGLDPESFFARHDHEQFARMALLERLPLRGRTVADVGCAGGSFLDAVSGFARQTVAIEPSSSYHNSLRTRGHQVYSDLTAARTDWAGRIDLAVSFSVIEHVDHPVAFLEGIRSLLAPSGVALVSTPNLDDVLMQCECEPYRRFFYRVVHRYYFGPAALKMAAQAAGFQQCDIVFRHRFPFSNFIGWLRDGRPTGAHGSTALGGGFDRLWTASLETSGAADYLYAFLTA